MGTVFYSRMGSFPSLRQIRRNFLKDVAAPGWRRKPMAAQPIVKFTGAQKELFDYLVERAQDCERQRARHLSTQD